MKAMTFSDRMRLAWKALTHSPQARRSAFMGADTSRLTNSWVTSPMHLNTALYQDLQKLRARSRELARNNEYGKKFLALVADNVVGHAGFSLQIQALRPDGSIDEADSNYLEDRFGAWGKPGNCDVTGRLSFTSLQRLLIRSVAQDGEAIVRKHRTGSFGYQLELVDPALLAEALQFDLPGGNKVRMSVEYDAMHRPVAYYFGRSDYADPRASADPFSNRYERVPAEEVFHLFLPEAVAQIRGVPWMAAAIYRLQMLGGYEEAAMVASRLGAAIGGFFETPDGDASALADATQGAAGAEELLMDVEPGVYRALPPGVKASALNPNYPHQMFGEFVKMCLRGVSAGFGVSYNSLANDLEGVNYSSIRAGVLEERETWKGIQGWMIETFLAPVYSEWLPQAIVAGQIKLPFSKLAKFDSAIWQGRRWDWVDPLKDTDANVTSAQNGLKSYSQIIREQGRDPEEVWRELEKDRSRLLTLGLNLDNVKAAAVAGGSDAQATP